MTLPPVRISPTDRERLAAIAIDAMRTPRAPSSAAILLSELARAIIIAEAELPPSVISMHSTVALRDDVNGVLSEMTLVFPDEEEPETGRVSVLSPLGAALIGLSEGDSICWSNATGDRQSVTVLRVKSR